MSPRGATSATLKRCWRGLGNGNFARRSPCRDLVSSSQRLATGKLHLRRRTVVGKRMFHLRTENLAPNFEFLTSSVTSVILNPLKFRDPRLNGLVTHRNLARRCYRRASIFYTLGPQTLRVAQRPELAGRTLLQVLRLREVVLAGAVGKSAMKPRPWAIFDMNAGC